MSPRHATTDLARTLPLITARRPDDSPPDPREALRRRMAGLAEQTRRDAERPPVTASHARGLAPP